MTTEKSRFTVALRGQSGARSGSRAPPARGLRPGRVGPQCPAFPGVPALQEPRPVLPRRLLALARVLGLQRRAAADRRPLARRRRGRARRSSRRSSARSSTCCSGRASTWPTRASVSSSSRSSSSRCGTAERCPLCRAPGRAGLPRLPGLQRQAEAGLHGLRRAGRCRLADVPVVRDAAGRAGDRRARRDGARIRARSTSCCARRRRASARPLGGGRRRPSPEPRRRARPARTRRFQSRLEPLPHPRVGLNPPPSWSTLPARSGDRQGESVPILCQFLHSGRLRTGSERPTSSGAPADGADGGRGAASGQCVRPAPARGAGRHGDERPS